MCRTAILGDANEGKIELLNAVIKAQESAINLIKPGISASDVYYGCYESLKGV